MASCAGIGEVIFDDWVEWVLRGHHGQKQENTRPFKWRGLGNYSGHTTLYSLAKKQDPNWTSALPSDLRFGAAGSAVGYSEFDALPNFDSVLDKVPLMNADNVIELPEPLPDAQDAPKRGRGRPKKSSDTLAKERENDVDQVRKILSGLRRNRLTHSIEYTDADGNSC